MSDKNAPTVDNPWRYSLTNCISGDNYLRSSEYYQLIAELDRLYVIEEQAKAAALLPSAADEPVAWMDSDGYVWTDLSHRRKYFKNEAPDKDHDPTPLFTRPASARPIAGAGALRDWWQAVEDDKSAQGEAFADHHAVIRYVGESVIATLTAGAIRAALSAPVAPAAEGWVLVPREPTAKMLSHAWDECALGGVETYRDFWRAMLAAAESPAQPEAK